MSTRVRPALALITLSAMPIAIVFMSKHFKLKHRELDLRAELQGREAETRLRALESRQAGLEQAVGALMSSVSALAAGQRLDSAALQAPDAPHTEAAPASLHAVPPALRDRR